MSKVPIEFEIIQRWPPVRTGPAHADHCHHDYGELRDAINSGMWVRLPTSRYSGHGVQSALRNGHGLRTEVRTAGEWVYIRKFPREESCASLPPASETSGTTLTPSSEPAPVQAGSSVTPASTSGAQP